MFGSRLSDIGSTDFEKVHCFVNNGSSASFAVVSVIRYNGTYYNYAFEGITMVFRMLYIFKRKANAFPLNAVVDVRPRRLRRAAAAVVTK